MAEAGNNPSRIRHRASVDIELVRPARCAAADADKFRRQALVAAAAFDAQQAHGVAFKRKGLEQKRLRAFYIDGYVVDYTGRVDMLQRPL